MKVLKVIGAILMATLMFGLWIGAMFILGFAVSDMILPVFGLNPTLMEGFWFVIGMNLVLSVSTTWSQVKEVVQEAVKK